MMSKTDKFATTKQREIMGAQTKALCLVVLRGAIDQMLHDLAISRDSTASGDQLFFKTFMPLVENFETEDVRGIFCKAFDVFSNEPIESRMKTVETVLQFVYANIVKLGAYLEAGKETAYGKE
jgi:hypothetical protein